jgi:hypothetical protein
MGIGKQGSPCRQFIKIGRFDLRMATQATNPIIQIINGLKIKRRARKIENFIL